MFVSSPEVVLLPGDIDLSGAVTGRWGLILFAGSRWIPFPRVDPGAMNFELELAGIPVNKA